MPPPPPPTPPPPPPPCTPNPLLPAPAAPIAAPGCPQPPACSPCATGCCCCWARPTPRAASPLDAAAGCRAGERGGVAARGGGGAPAVLPLLSRSRNSRKSGVRAGGRTQSALRARGERLAVIQAWDCAGRGRAGISGVGEARGAGRWWWDSHLQARIKQMGYHQNYSSSAAASSPPSAWAPWSS